MNTRVYLHHSGRHVRRQTIKLFRLSFSVLFFSTFLLFSHFFTYLYILPINRTLERHQFGSAFAYPKLWNHNFLSLIIFWMLFYKISALKLAEKGMEISLKLCQSFLIHNSKLTIQLIILTTRIAFVWKCACTYKKYKYQSYTLKHIELAQFFKILKFSVTRITLAQIRSHILVLYVPVQPFFTRMCVYQYLHANVAYLLGIMRMWIARRIVFVCKVALMIGPFRFKLKFVHFVSTVYCMLVNHSCFPFHYYYCHILLILPMF